MKRWIPFRTAVLVPVVVLLAATAALLMSPLPHHAAQAGLSAALATDVTFGSLSITPWSLTLTFRDLEVRDRNRPGENLLTAREGRGQLSAWELLRGRGVIREMVLSGVRARVERNEDGTFNIEDLGSEEEPVPPTDEQKEAARLSDWLETIRNSAEKLQEWRDRIARRRKERAERRPPVPPPEERARGRSEYIRYDAPRFVIETIRIEDVELELSDRTKPEPLPPLTGGEILIENLSSNPLNYAPPIQVNLKGMLGDTGALQLKSLVSLYLGDTQTLALNVESRALPLALLRPLFGLSIPVAFTRGIGDLKADLALTDFSQLALLPVIAIRDMELAPDGRHDRVLGIRAEDFCEAANHAREFAIQGLSITGTLASPTFTWDAAFRESLEKMLIDAGKGALVSEARKHLAPLADKAAGQIEKALGPDAAGKIDEVLGDGVGDTIKKEGEDLLKKATDFLPGLRR